MKYAITIRNAENNNQETFASDFFGTAVGVIDLFLNMDQDEHNALLRDLEENFTNKGRQFFLFFCGPLIEDAQGLTNRKFHCAIQVTN